MISIIIPCYNSEKYISKNLDSLINQTNKEFKAVFIDDGSTDNTTSIIREKLEDTDVNYEIHITNHKGVGAARNYGINVCNSTFIMFLDSDDYLKKDCIENFIRAICEESIDVVISEYEHEYNNKTVWNYKKSYIELDLRLNSNKVLNLILDNRIHVCTSNAIYKLNLFNDINFSTDCVFHEDLNVFYKIINRSKKIKFIKNSTFVYVIRDNSISHNLNISKLHQGMQMLEELYSTFENENSSSDILNKIKKKTMPNICFLFFNNLCLSNKDLVQVYTNKKYFKIMRSAKLENLSIKAILKYYRIKLIGYFPRLYIKLWSAYQCKIKKLLRR